ncbi:MAG: hypothetical protein E5299_02534 [Burkholderia gladioli]|nr:MAG: hypothetical protein E5299_02534 [Burkholderia gladioli]
MRSGTAIMKNLDELRHSIQACRICRDTPQYLPPLPHEPNPVCIISIPHASPFAGRRRVFACITAPCPSTTHQVIVCGNGSVPREKSFTIPRVLRLCQWAFAFQAMTNMAEIILHAESVGRRGMTTYLPPCRNWSSFSSSGNTPLPIICLNGTKPVSPKRFRTGAASWKRQMPTVERFYLCRIHRGATVAGLNEIRGLMRKPYQLFSIKYANSLIPENNF